MSHRFSPRPNQASEIQWRVWGAEAFAEAVALDKPILLNLTAVWCHWCHLMDETTYSSAELIKLINDNLIPVRVDADEQPHVQDRYIAGGWPTNAFLTPTGEVLWAGTYVPEEQFTQVATSVLSAWNERRDELKLEIERRRKALDAARGRHHGLGLVRRETADDVLSATIDSYDERNGGFGTEPKFPYVDPVELLFIQGQRDNTDYLRMAEHTLDGMMAGELWDAEHGGFYRYATGADWSAPRLEKLLSVNAAMLRIYALGASLQKRDDWRSICERIVAWADETLALPNGLWASSEVADVGLVDDVVYTNYNAQWIRALAIAGARLGKSEWVTRAQRAHDTLLDSMAAPGDLVFHYQRGKEKPQIGFLLLDAADVLAACLAVAQATGQSAYLDHARRIALGMERTYWAEDGAFWDRQKGADELGVLKYRDKPFETNAECARWLNELSIARGEPSFRALAERILAVLSPQAGRYGVGGAGYAIAVDEFFDTPTRVFVVGKENEATSLREAALKLPLANVRVFSLPEGGRIGHLNFAANTGAAAYIATARGNSSAIADPQELQEALVKLR